jgi:hypothetical protein
MVGGIVVGALVGTGDAGGNVGLGVLVAVGGSWVGVELGGTGMSVAVGSGVLVVVGRTGVGVLVGGCEGTGDAVAVGGRVVCVGAGAGVPVQATTSNKTTTSENDKRRDMVTSSYTGSGDTSRVWTLWPTTSYMLCLPEYVVSLAIPTV